MTATDTKSGEVTRDGLVEAARALFPMIREEAESAEKARKLPDHVFSALRERGFFRILQPRRFGGYEFEPETAARVVLELSAACGSTGWVASCAISHQWMVAQFPIACQEEVWRDRPDQLTVSSFSPAGECVRVDGGFRISGTWRYASGCDHADFALLGVRIPPGNGAGNPVPGFLIVPIGECTKVDDWDTMGLAATGSHAVAAEDVFVPAHRSITVQEFGAAETPGLEAFDTNLGRYPVFSVGAHCLAATAVGCLQGALDEFVASLQHWRTRGLAANIGARVAEFPAVQMRVGRAGAALKAARALLFSQMEDTRRAVLDRGEILDTAGRIDNRVAQGYAIQLALQGLDELWGAAGGTGIHHSELVQRAWRDAHAVSHHVFFNWDAVSALYGQHRLGLDPIGQF